MRISIYVPDELHSRMQTVGEDANWSELAQRAFEQKIGEIAATKKEKNMSDVIDRLRASKAKANSELALFGKEAAKKWCENHAEFDGLQRVAKYRESLGIDFNLLDWSDGALAKAIVGLADHGDSAAASWSDVRDFFESYHDDEDVYSSEEFCTGFLNEVERFFADIESKL